ncbi:MFS transporter [Bradyrhizobium sp. dw_78]|uniref:MFS transporter n=1 Tax=Bradyrhizobium sp. dw_78 TaxID=2719793 RepID=UPI001BD4592F|nr:MFS transporter [Bradyrhizobium sp. dw_78]
MPCQETKGPSSGQVLTMAVAAGVTVANLYYNQPILAEIATSLHAKEIEVGYLPALTQAAYGVGLFFLAPLGDMFDRKKLVLVLQGLLCLALVAITFVQTLPALYVASVLVGLFAVSTQIIMPMAAALAANNAKGKVVGTVFTGALIGILSARIVGGYLAEWAGWRSVYGVSAGLVLAATIVFAAMLPQRASHHTGHYGDLLKSTLLQLKRVQLLRVMLVGSLVFGLFCSFWTALTFHLSGPPFTYSSDRIGLFGILAIAGAGAASVFGRIADKRHPLRIQILTVSIIIASIVCLFLWPYSVPALAVGVLLLDVGVQATQVNNLAQIYGLDETAHSRINTVYMTTLFLGGAIGTYGGVLAWNFGGWPLVCGQLLLWAGLALAILLFRLYRENGRRA